LTIRGVPGRQEEHMRKIDNRQTRLTRIRLKPTLPRIIVKAKKGRRYDSKLDRRGMSP